jgi:site-specific DNA-methyltransferase (cytosine-N4-specific)
MEPSRVPQSAFSYEGAGSGIVIGDAWHSLQLFPDRTFRCCVTTPPYWGLRDYGIPNQIGAEKGLDEYIANLTEIFQQVKRVLRDDGTLWLNIGDSYTSGNRTWRDADKKNPARGMDYRPPTPEGLKPKDLIGVPWRIAFALQADGWYLRSDIVWYSRTVSPNPSKTVPRERTNTFFCFRSRRTTSTIARRYLNPPPRRPAPETGERFGASTLSHSRMLTSPRFPPA